MSTVYPFPGDPTKYEDIDGLSGEMWVPLMEITLEKNASTSICVAELIASLKRKFDECICAEDDGAGNSPFVAFTCGKFAMILTLTRAMPATWVGRDSRAQVIVAMCVKKKIGSHAVEKAATAYIAARMYGALNEALKDASLQILIKDRVSENKVVLSHEVFDAAVTNGNTLDIPTIAAATEKSGFFDKMR
jgi:hypothetical protein